MCFDEGLLTPKMIMTDVPINYQGYAPENYDQKFNGYVTVEYALEHSLNIPAVKGLQLLGHDKLIQKLADCNFNQVKKDQHKLGLSMILGGCGTTLEELTGLFSSFANKGIFYSPSYTSADTVHKKVTLISDGAAYMIDEILSKVNRPDFPLSWSATEKMPKIAWKTGTSYGRRDGWSIGFNKNYTVGVWCGNFSGVGVPDLSGAETATPLLFKIFNTIDYDSDEDWFSPPEDCEERLVCSETGLPPGENCTGKILDKFIPLISSTRPCNNRQEVLLSVDEKISYCKTCMPESGYKKKLMRITEPEMQAYFSENGMSYEKIPPHNENCEVIFKGNAPHITFPINGSEYLISKKNPEPLMLTCKTAADVNKVYWYIDNKFFKAAHPAEKQFFLPTEGPVKISCTDDKGRNRNIRIVVKFVTL
jgi:penicillin-binding protein 1C